jgi:hypothetical protein
VTSLYNSGLRLVDRERKHFRSCVASEEFPGLGERIKSGAR